MHGNIYIFLNIWEFMCSRINCQRNACLGALDSLVSGAERGLRLLVFFFSCLHSLAVDVLITVICTDQPTEASGKESVPEIPLSL